MEKEKKPAKIKRAKRWCQKCKKPLNLKLTKNMFFCPPCHKIVSEYVEEW